MKRFFAIVRSDWKRRRNIELYVILIVSIFFIFYDIFQTQTYSLQIILAAIAILIYNVIDARHFREHTEEKLDEINIDNSSGPCFQEWDGNTFTEKLSSANEVSMLSITNYEFLHKRRNAFVKFVKRGGKLRFIYIKPDSDATKMVLAGGWGADIKPIQLQNRINLTFGLLKELASHAPELDNIQVKFIDYLPGSLITMIDHEDTEGMMFVTLREFKMRTGIRPSFTLRNQIDRRWYDFYATVFDNFWDWSKSETVDLTRECTFKVDD